MKSESQLSLQSSPCFGDLHERARIRSLKTISRGVPQVCPTQKKIIGTVVTLIIAGMYWQMLVS